MIASEGGKNLLRDAGRVSRKGKDNSAGRKRCQLNVVTLAFDTQLRLKHIGKFVDSALVTQLTKESEYLM